MLRKTQRRALPGILFAVIGLLVGAFVFFQPMLSASARNADVAVGPGETIAAPRAGRHAAAKPADDDGHTWSRRDALSYFACHLSVPRGFEHSEVRLMRGDDARWARPDWDDSMWQDVTALGVPQRAGIFWLRYRVREANASPDAETESTDGPSRGDRKLPDGIFQKVNASFDLFWDGRLLARSGVPGNTPAEETPGKVDTVFSLPEDWQGPGEHVVALRMSTQFSDFPGERTDFNTGFGSPQELEAQLNRAAFQPTLASGAMFMVAAMGFVLWLLAERRPTLLLFVGVCLCAALTQWLTVWRYFYPYTYDWHFPLRMAAVYLSAGLGACLLMFVAIFFAVPLRGWLFAGYVFATAVILWLPRDIYMQPLNHKAGGTALVGFALSLGCAGWAAWRHRPGAWLVAAGLFVSTVALGWRPADFVTGGFFPMTLPTMLGLLSAVALQVRDERRRARDTQLTAARLELELLRKNLQPHFLMNTLTALSEVIEQDAGAAVALIDDLATELRTLSRMSREKQVSVAQEIELCRVHLRVMSVRTAVAWSLAAEGVDENETVPPAIFLTLVENAFVHQRPVAGGTVFRLRRETGAGEVRYAFLAPGEVRAAGPARAAGGTGLRYVQARLEESFPGRWTFAHHAAPGGWETILSVRVRDDGGPGR